MIRIEVDNEADVTRLVAAFTTLPVLRDSDYEIFLLPVVWPHDSGGDRRAWRKNGEHGATDPTDWDADVPERPWRCDTCPAPGVCDGSEECHMSPEYGRRYRREQLEYTDRNRGLMSPAAREELARLRAGDGDADG